LAPRGFKLHIIIVKPIGETVHRIVFSLKTRKEVFFKSFYVIVDLRNAKVY
jgi:hypothetical protein